MMSRIIFAFNLLFFLFFFFLGYFFAFKNHKTAKHINLLRLYYEVKLDKLKEKSKRTLYNAQETSLQTHYIEKRLIHKIGIRKFSILRNFRGKGLFYRTGFREHVPG